MYIRVLSPIKHGRVVAICATCDANLNRWPCAPETTVLDRLLRSGAEAIPFIATTAETAPQMLNAAHPRALLCLPLGATVRRRGGNRCGSRSHSSCRGSGWNDGIGRSLGTGLH